MPEQIPEWARAIARDVKREIMDAFPMTNADIEDVLGRALAEVREADIRAVAQMPTDAGIDEGGKESAIRAIRRAAEAREGESG